VDIVSTNITVADYCAALERREITVNKEYQRSDKVWPTIAKAYLIETIVLGFPIPKLSLYQKTDLKSKKTIKEIVDGQQRSMAIFDFFKNDFSLPVSLETESLKGKTYDQLEEDDQQNFLEFGLSVDLFVAATQEDVVEVFRRMNSYTVPLNAEEQRHATFQGPFKWFVNRLCKRFNKSFVDVGIFGEKQLVRMADTKLVSEVCDAILFGIRTTNKKILDRLYRDHDRKFAGEADLDARLTGGLDELRMWDEIWHTALTKYYIMYSLILAMIHLKKPVQALQGVYKSRPVKNFDRRIALAKSTFIEHCTG
jgi:uncharacterized protein DUF262